MGKWKWQFNTIEPSLSRVDVIGGMVNDETGEWISVDEVEERINYKGGIAMLEYGIAYNNTLPGLIMETTRMIAEGWQPQGGITCVPTDYKGDFSGCFLQAMVKPDRQPMPWNVPAEVKAGV